MCVLVPGVFLGACDPMHIHHCQICVSTVRVGAMCILLLDMGLGTAGVLMLCGGLVPVMWVVGHSCWVLGVLTW